MCRDSIFVAVVVAVVAAAASFLDALFLRKSELVFLTQTTKHACCNFFGFVDVIHDSKFIRTNR